MSFCVGLSTFRLFDPTPKSGVFASQHGGRIFQALVLRSAGSGNPTKRTHSATLLAALCRTSEAQFWQKRELGCLKVEVHEDSRCLRGRLLKFYLQNASRSFLYWNVFHMRCCILKTSHGPRYERMKDEWRWYNLSITQLMQHDRTQTNILPIGWNNHHRSQPIGWLFICAHLPWLLCEATRYSSLGPIHQHCSSAKTRRLVVRVAGIVQGTTRCQSRKAFYPRTKSGGRSSNQDSGDFLHGKNEHLSVSSLGRNCE